MGGCYRERNRRALRMVPDTNILFGALIHAQASPKASAC